MQVINEISTYIIRKLLCLTFEWPSYVLSHFVFIKTWNHVSIAADADQYTMLSCIDQIKQMTKIFMTLSDTKNTNLRNTLYLYTVLADK